MNQQFGSPEEVMRLAITLARRGWGAVEPNPQVGVVIVDDNLRLLSEGYHQRYGGLHAEREALQKLNNRAEGATLFVTLEPCQHQGKTPPCTTAVIAAGIKRVYIGCPDPAPHTAGRGIEQLRHAGIEVHVGLLQQEAELLIRPFTKLMLTGRPYVHAKWAMTLDGKIATARRSSKWISGSQSREYVHNLRGRMDAIIVGSGTARADDPLLTARPAGFRTALRVVIDSQARLALDSQLVRTATEIPVMVACTEQADSKNTQALTEAGVEIFHCNSDDNNQVHLSSLLAELGKRQLTNLFVEGGSELLGHFFDHQLIDECHLFIASKIIGGAGGLSPFGGVGRELMSQAVNVAIVEQSWFSTDLYIRGLIESADWKTPAT